MHCTRQGHLISETSVKLRYFFQFASNYTPWNSGTLASFLYGLLYCYNYNVLPRIVKRGGLLFTSFLMYRFSSRNEYTTCFVWILLVTFLTKFGQVSVKSIGLPTLECSLGKEKVHNSSEQLQIMMLVGWCQKCSGK